MELILLLSICFFVSLIVGFLLIRFALRCNLMDVPVARSSHARPTPTLGGLAIVAAFLIGVVLTRFFLVDWNPPVWIGWLVAGAGVVACVGLLDDLFGLPVVLRLILNVVAAGFPIFGGIRLNVFDGSLLGIVDLKTLEIPMTTLWIMAIINFYNFMDGIDGLAVGVGVVVLGFLGYIGWRVGNRDILVLGSLLGGACLGFAWHNFPPARIFMGDVGSTFIGYVLGVLALAGHRGGGVGHVPLWIPALLLGTFLFDTVVTLGRRILKKEKWYAAHRQHYYQRMTKLGFSHRTVTLSECGMTFLLGISALLGLGKNWTSVAQIFLVWLLVFMGVARWIGVNERRISEEGK